MPIDRFAVTLTGVEQVIRGLNATEKQVKRAAINATNTTSTKSKQRVARRIAAGTGVPAAMVNKRIRQKRVDIKRNRLSATISSQGSRIAVRFWKKEVVQPTRKNAHPTRAYVRIQDSLNGGKSNAFAWVNPKSKKKIPHARYASDYQLIYPRRGMAGVRTEPPGHSLKNPFAEAIDSGELRAVQKNLRDQFDKKLRDQIRKATP